MYKILITADAEKDIDIILNYITNTLCNSEAAKSLATEIIKKYKRISENPYMYELYPDKLLADKGYRKVTVKNYMIFYIVNENDKTVTVMRVIYGRRDHKNLIQ